MECDREVELLWIALVEERRVALLQGNLIRSMKAIITQNNEKIMLLEKRLEMLEMEKKQPEDTFESAESTDTAPSSLEPLNLSQVSSTPDHMIHVDSFCDVERLSRQNLEDAFLSSLQAIWTMEIDFWKTKFRSLLTQQSDYNED